MWLGIAMAVGLIVWAVGGLIALNPLPWQIRKYWDVPGERELRIIQAIALLLIVAGVTVFFVTAPGSFLHDLWPEMISTGGAILGIDELNRRRIAQEYKRGIIRQMRSQSNDFALDAVRIAEEEMWLYDGSLKRAYLLESNLKEVKLWEANLKEALLMKVNLRDAVLPRINLKGANLMGADLEGASLERANLTEAILMDANLKRINLEGAQLVDAHLEGVNLEGAQLVDANLTEAILLDANLERANLTEAILLNANLERANLTEAILLNANLEGAKFWNFRNAIRDRTEFGWSEIDWTKIDWLIHNPMYRRISSPRTIHMRLYHLAGAIYNNGTQWPDNFDPKAEGAVNWDELSEEEQEEWEKKYRSK